MTKVMEIILGEKSEQVSDKFYVNEKDFEIPHGEDYKLAIQELEKIQKKSIHGKQFLSLFEYDNVSLWWFIYQSLIPKYKHITNFIEKFSEFLDHKQPQVVRIEKNSDKIELIKQICEQKKIRLEYSSVSEVSQKSQKKIKNIIQKRRFDKITKSKIQFRKKLFFEKSDNLLPLQNKILFMIPTSYRREIFNQRKEISERGEHLLQPIMDFLNYENIIGIDLDYTFKGDFDILSERLNDSSLKWVPLEIYIQSNKDSKNFLENYSNVINDSDFQQLFYFKKIFLWSYLDEFFQSMIYAPYLPFYLKIINSFEEQFSKNLPKCIFFAYETGPIALAMIGVAKKFGIKTIGIQHGHIYKFNPMYSFSEFQNEKNPLGFLVPDKILLFGNESKKLLIKNGYPKEQLQVFGNPNFFNIEKIKQMLSKKALNDKFKIPKNKKIILLTTGKLQPFYSTHGIYDYDVKIWDFLLKTYKNNPNYFLILKPHPQEKNIDIYIDILNKNKNSNAKIIQDNINELIFISSLVISVFSTTMLDSLCFNKPVIRVTFPGDINPIFDDTSAICKSSLDNLSYNIQKLENEKTKTDFLIDAKKFVYEHYGIPENDVEDKIKLFLNNLPNNSL